MPNSANRGFCGSSRSFSISTRLYPPPETAAGTLEATALVLGLRPILGSLLPPNALLSCGRLADRFFLFFNPLVNIGVLEAPRARNLEAWQPSATRQTVYSLCVYLQKFRHIPDGQNCNVCHCSNLTSRTNVSQGCEECPKWSQCDPSLAPRGNLPFKDRVHSKVSGQRNRRSFRRVEAK